jgi:calcineurin-like phosphoesterase family protein
MVRKTIESVKWFTSDHHFGHRNIIKYDNRPFETVAEMDECMITRWNEKISPEDNVYIVGDFSFYRHDTTAELVKKLNGKKHLIWGNHDDHNRNRLLKIFDSVYDQVILQLANNIRVKVCHFPYVAPEESQEHPRHKKFRPHNEGHWLICGHVHLLWKINESLKCINVGVPVWDFYPVNHDKIIAIINGFKHENNPVSQITETTHNTEPAK